MTLEIFKKGQKKKMSAITDNKVLDNKKYEREETKHEVRETNQNESFLIKNTPDLDLGKILSPQSKEILERSAGISRSHGLTEIKPIHVFYSLLSEIEDKNVDKILLIIDKKLGVPQRDSYEVRNNEMMLSTETEETLKDSLESSLEEGNNRIEPEDIFETLLKKDYTEISDFLHRSGVELE